MSFKANVSLNYATHLPLLIKAVEKTNGDILELGMGVFSTPYLHYISILHNRRLVSYENYQGWLDKFVNYRCETHEINFVEKYSDAKIDKAWDVVLIDQTPDLSRAEEAKRLANFARFIVIHDSNENQRGYESYNYASILPLFRYKKIWDKDKNHSTVLSNFVDLEDFLK